MRRKLETLEGYIEPCTALQKPQTQHSPRGSKAQPLTGIKPDMVAFTTLITGFARTGSGSISQSSPVQASQANRQASSQFQSVCPSVGLFVCLSFLSCLSCLSRLSCLSWLSCLFCLVCPVVPPVTVCICVPVSVSLCVCVCTKVFQACLLHAFVVAPYATNTSLEFSGLLLRSFVQVTIVLLCGRPCAFLVQLSVRPVVRRYLDLVLRSGFCV